MRQGERWGGFSSARPPAPRVRRSAGSVAGWAPSTARDEYGRPTVGPWTEQQTEVYEEAWRVWRGRAADVQLAITKYAKDEDPARNDVEADVKKQARHPELASA